MSHRNHLVMPYPVLSSQRDDYAPECYFRMYTPHAQLGNRGQDIIVTVKYHLRSATLHQLIANRQACYCVLIECYRTYRRESQRAWDDEDLLVLECQDWQDKLTLTPYIVTTAPVLGFTASEHSPLVQTLIPNGVDLPAGAILAIGDTTEVTLDNDSVESVFDLVSDKQLEPGRFATDLTRQRIAINVHPDDLRQINRIRSQSHAPLLHQALYLYALEKGVRNLVDHSDKRWAKVLERVLQDMELLSGDAEDQDAEEWAENAERYAQIIFQQPLVRMLQALQPLQQEEIDE